MDDVGYGALAFSLTLLAGIYTWFAYQRRGLGAGLRGAAFTLLPVAAYLTKTLEMFGRIFDAIGDWATRLVFSPVVWLGVVVAGISVVLFGAARLVDRRGGNRDNVAAAPKAVATASPQDNDLDDIEALLRNRGIS